MMAEYYALSTCMREVLPMRELIQTVAKGVGLNEKCATTFKTTVWEDNNGALALVSQHGSWSAHPEIKVLQCQGSLVPIIPERQGQLHGC